MNVFLCISGFIHYLWIGLSAVLVNATASSDLDRLSLSETLCITRTEEWKSSILKCINNSNALQQLVHPLQ